MSERQKVIEELLMLKRTVKMNSDADLALNYAIDSLKTDEAYCLIYEKPELCEDYVSRKAVKKILQYIRISIEKGYGFDYEKWLDRVEDLARVIPKAEDVVSREEVFKIMDDIETAVHEGDGFQYSEWCGQVYMLPNVMPKAKKGHWICDGKGRSFADYHCSECGLKLALCGQDIKQRQDSGYSLFCGGCGADMREVEE